MEALERLKGFAEKSEEGFARVEARRLAWKEASTGVILPALEEAIRYMAPIGNRRGLYAQTLDKYTNFGLVQFWSGSIPTGINRAEVGRGFSLGTEKGAALVFGQGEDGQVQTLAYPFMTELPDEPNKKKRGPWVGLRFESPSDLTRQKVLEVLESFLLWSAQTTIFKGDSQPDKKDDVWAEIVDGKVERPSTLVAPDINKLDELAAMMRETSDSVKRMEPNLQDLHKNLKDEELIKLLKSMEPLYKTLTKRVIQAVTKGIIKESDLD